MPRCGWKSSIQRGCILLALGWSVGTVRPANALDPDRSLSQALLRIWQVPQGLPRAAIFSIRQTRDGYLWLGTQAGLYRFDGVRFQPAKGDDGLPLSVRWIRDLCEDDDRNLWIATDDEGLIRLADRTATRFGRAQGLPSEHIACVLANRRGELWVGTDRGLARYYDGKFQTYAVADGLRDADIRALAEGPDGALWIGSAGPQIARWDGATFRPVALSALPPRGTITALHVAADQTVWIGTTAGLLRQVGDDERLLTAADGLGHELVHRLVPAGRGGVWVGTKDGLCRIHGDRIEKFQTQDGLSQSTVYALCEDHEGGLWAGTKHGLNQLADRRTLLPFTVREGLPSNATGPILQDAAGAVWVGTLDAGLARFDGRRFETVATMKNGLTSDTILSLADGGALGLWIGTAAGLCRWHQGQVAERFTTADGLPSDMIQCLMHDAAGTLWAGTQAGVTALSEGKFVRPEGDAAAVGKSVQVLLRRGDTLLAASTGGGLNEITAGAVRPSRLPLSVDAEVDAFYLDDRERLWTALRGRGLGLIDGGRALSFGVKDGLFDDDISGLAGDDEGRLWAACSRGIFSVLLEDLQKFAAGDIPRVTSTPFSPTDALRTIECQTGVQPAVWRMRDGCMWFSTIRGIIVIDPQRGARPLPRPSILIDEVQVNGQEVAPARLGRLPPGRTNLDFHYTALSFASPGRITFRYRLEGFDPDWIEAGSRREAFYTNLTPGEYQFRVQATNSDGARYEAERPIAFTLEPHFSETRWFLPLIFAIVAGLGGIIYRFRVRQIKAGLQTVLAERIRIARELHDTLIQGFSGVTMQLQALAARLSPSSERATLAEIIQDAGGCLREARQSIAGLRNASGLESGLAAAITRAARQLTETSDVRLRLWVDPVPTKLPADVEYNLLRIVQEAISNVLKHADATLVEVTLQSDSETIVLSIRDDGAGFDAARQRRSPQPQQYGLIGMRERAAQIGALITWQSEPGRGTTVTIRRPLPTAGAATCEPEPSASAAKLTP